MTVPSTALKNSGADDPAAMTAMAGLPREMRGSELCTTELREQLRNSTPPYWPDLLPAYRLGAGSVLEVREAAFRARGQWYDLSFRCEVDADATRVLSFAFNVGDAIPRDQWVLGTRYDGVDEGSGLVELEMVLTGGFEPGVIYELIYEARGSVVQGIGFAAMRDLVSFLKYDRSEMNPLRRADGTLLAERVIGEGRSQSGRAIRMFLHEGFNADEQGRQVFDGLIPTIAGGGQGFFNHRFASPTRAATQHAGHLYPADLFPFTYGDETDPFTGRTDGLLRRARASGTVCRR